MMVNQAAAALLIGLTLLMGALADAGGRLRNPGAGGFVYMAAVVIVAGAIYFDRKKRSTAKQRILGCLSWNLSCRKRSSPPATDIAVRARIRVVPYTRSRGIATRATSAADESRGDDGRREERHTLETACLCRPVNSSS